MISGDWTKKSTGESGATTRGSCASSGKRSKKEEEDREARKWKNLTKKRCSQKTT